VDDIIAELTNTPLRLFDTDLQILENNIYGVDINDESIEIAKLSLWLRTAQPGRKLSDLSRNIRCGNSLIDDPAVAGDKAFNWQQAFPDVFTKGGFDVVIGNPPYVRQELFKDIKPYLETTFECYNSVADLYTYFIEKGIKILNQFGVFSFILPNKFLKATYGNEIRRVIKKSVGIRLIYDFDDYPVFSDATTYPLIFIFDKNKDANSLKFSAIDKKIIENPIEILKNREITIRTDSLKENGEWNFIGSELQSLLEKIKLNSTPLSSVTNKEIYLGIKTGKNEAFIISKAEMHEITSNDTNANELIKPVATGQEIRRYCFENNEKYLISTGYDIDIPNKYPGIYKWLLQFEDDLKKRGDKGKNWWNLRPCDYYDKIGKSKIIWRSITNECGFYLDEIGDLTLSNNNYFIASASHSLLGILNSKLSFVFLKNICTTLQGGFYDFRRDKVMTIPIHRNFHMANNIADAAKKIQKLHKDFDNKSASFLHFLSQSLGISTSSRSINEWYNLSFGEFIKELNKLIKTQKGEMLTKIREMEWMELFEENKKKVVDLKTQIDQTDREIDRMVYALYGLTEEEIAIVEGS